MSASSFSLPRLELARGVTLRHPLLLPLLDLVSFEAVVTLFVFAPRYKMHPLLAGSLPVDPTLVFFVLSVAIAPVIILRRGIYMPGLVLFGSLMFLLFWMFVSGSWSPSRIFAREKFINFTVLCVWTLFCFALIIANDRERVARFFRLWVYFAAWLALEVFLVWAEQGFRGRVYIYNDTENYLGYGNVCGPAALIMLAAWASQRRVLGLKSLAAAALLVWLALPLAVGGGRGPLISMMISMCVVGLLGFDMRQGRVAIYRIQLPIIMVAIAGLGFVGWAIGNQVDIETINRLGLLVGDDIGGSAEDRMVQLGKATELFAAKPFFGWGIGSYGVLAFGRDENLYPHNLFVELALEYGIVGVLLFLIPVFVALRQISVQRLINDRLFLTALMIFVQALIALQTSFSFTENRNFMIALGLMVMRAAVPEGTEQPAANPPPMPTPVRTSIRTGPLGRLR